MRETEGEAQKHEGKQDYLICQMPAAKLNAVKLFTDLLFLRKAGSSVIPGG